MPKLINCLAVAEDGTWFTTRVNKLAFMAANPNLQIFALNQRVTIYKPGLLTSGRTGSIKAFSRNAAGTLLAEVDWLAGAPPLRVTIAALMRRAPKKFWMVIPFNTSHSSQATSFSSNARTGGISPAVTRFESVEAAQAYIVRERSVTGWQDYSILESVGLSTPTSYLTNPS